ncbi:Glycosyl transferase family 2 [Neolewinella agarilytica]|uniref:Glycosyl transferase family 2 n=1 Tax=Neolewinella agarilytica TaxID=478744 RepID=A0A1H9DZY0_9BACT|nr:Glycosyl transferase family 2 [Neolewinella agarilytica]
MEGNKKLVSVITVVYNDQAGLRKTINSVVAQGSELLEYIVIDGGSKDGTVETAEEFSANIDRFVSEPDGGIYDAMNKGLRLATGQWAIFMNAGDTFAGPDVLNGLADKFDPAYAIVFGDVEVGNGRIKKQQGLFDKLGLLTMICHQSLFFNLALVPREELLYRHKEYGLSADMELLLRLQRDYGASFGKKADLVICNYDKGGVSDQQVGKRLAERERLVKTYLSGKPLSLMLHRLQDLYLRRKLLK